MKKSYTEILKQKIEIPIIQRDYAQGRKDDKTTKIRKDFLDVIFDTLKSNLSGSSKVNLELDFIYGFSQEDKNGGTFIPIDGQQRLTTLWLLYWFVSVKEQIGAEEKTFLANFIYETRHSTTVFCKKLIGFQPSFSGRSIADDIRNQPWYFDTWDYDPSIQAMLVVLKEIESRYQRSKLHNVWDILQNDHGPFYFYKLDMDKVGLSDDLYIKMNSRGKALTEFEYFKAGFTEVIKDESLKQRFEKSVDQEWIDAIWKIVKENVKDEGNSDIALLVDDSFLNLFNYITNILALKNDLGYKNTIESTGVIKSIYSDNENLLFLFEILDTVSEMPIKNTNFWEDTFYYVKHNFATSKVRLFFTHEEKDLLKRCLFDYNKGRGLSYPEQLLLYACLIHVSNDSKNFISNIRVTRNLVANSENELRGNILGRSFQEIENLVLNGSLIKLEHFKTDQIKEEREKKELISSSAVSEEIIKKLEDSDIFRGSISLFEFNEALEQRAIKFLDIFDEDKFHDDFINRSNLLLCFGDYSQDDGGWTNLLSPNRGIMRRFFTTPGFGKQKHIYSETRPVLMRCLDYFNENPTVSLKQKLDSKLKEYDNIPKDWIYYFLKYPSFRKECFYGYYWWIKENENHYIFYKMRKKQFNGYNWQANLYEVVNSINSKKVTLDNYDSYLIISKKKSRIRISTSSEGFLFEDENENNATNKLLQQLIHDGIINSSGTLEVAQNKEGVDMEDRIEKLKATIQYILKEY